MIWLRPTRYLCTWAKKIKTRTIVFNPEFGKDYLAAIKFWDRATRYRGNKEDFSEVVRYLIKPEAKTKKAKTNGKYPLNFGFVSDLPKSTIISKIEYEKFLAMNTAVFSERFMSPDELHSGSSRHLLLNDVQIKGSGRNMLVSRSDYIHSWGGATEIEGIHSYLISNLLNIQLPLGACPTFKIDLIKKYNSAQLMRLNHSLRLAQYSPYLSIKEKQMIRDQLIETFQSSDPDFMLRQVAFNLASYTFLNYYNFSMISENMLMDGGVIDCETIYNGESLKYQTLYLDLAINGKKADKIERKKINNWKYLEEIFDGDQDTTFCNSTMHGLIHIFKRYQAAYEELFNTKLPSLEEYYWEMLDQVYINMTGACLDNQTKCQLIDFQKAPCEIIDQHQEDLTFNWKEVTKGFIPLLDKDNPINVFFLTKENRQVILRVRLNFKRINNYENSLIEQFNKRKRLSMHYQATISMETNEISDPIERASAFNHEINRTTFSYPLRLNKAGIVEKNELSLEEIDKNYSIFRDRVWHYAYLDQSGNYLEEEGLPSSVPLKAQIVLFETSHKKNKFKYLTKPLLINT